jgi:beta-glucosidase/6-phospho-beta-glucosidase/beta-galactosidase
LSVLSKKRDENCERLQSSKHRTERDGIGGRRTARHHGISHRFESTYLPDHDTDILETTRHLDLFGNDLQLVANAGIRALRYPVPWHRIEREPGRYDWAWMDSVMAAMQRLGLDPIVDPVHHTSFPGWMEKGFLDERFVGSYTTFVLAFAERYRWVRRYTPFNEPMPTTFFCAHEGIWKPYEAHERHWLKMATTLRVRCRT